MYDKKISSSFDLVSVIIPSYNRFKYLLNAIQSVKEQTYPNIEIIVVNDRSTQEEYYNYDWKDVNVIHLDKNTKDRLGYPCAAFVRNKGIAVANGKYVAFLDDDDLWFKNKISLQIALMKECGSKTCCSEGYMGKGIFDKTKKYNKYNSEQCFEIIKDIFKRKKSNLLDNGYPDVWDYDFLSVHNCAPTSSVVVEAEILKLVNGFKLFKNGEEEDYDCWLRCLKHTKMAYVHEPTFYYDDLHGMGRNY